jgi:Ca2+-binding EF-hand superfamily protein
MPPSILPLSLLATAAAAATPPATPITVTGHAWAPFISPMGEPFRAQTVTDDTLADWFARADRNHDGAITAEELVADAEHFFATLDTNHDGQIDPDELAQYEWQVAPEIQVMSKTRRAPGDAAAKAPGTDPPDDPLDPKPRRHRDAPDGSLGIAGALQGAARYGLLNIPEPVAAADSDFNRAISLEEFRAAANARFLLLDTAHQGRLALSQLEAIRSAQLAAGSRGKRDKNAPDPRIGNPLPPGR